MQGRGGATATGIDARPTVLVRSDVKRRRSDLERELAELNNRSSPSTSRTPSPAIPPIPIAESFVGGQRFEEINAEEARIEAEAQQRLSSGRWFRMPSYGSSPPKAKAD